MITVTTKRSSLGPQEVDQRFIARFDQKQTEQHFETSKQRVAQFTVKPENEQDCSANPTVRLMS